MAATIHAGPAGPAGAVSDGTVLSLARLLRALSVTLGAGLGVIVAGSALAFGAVHPWARLPLFEATAVLALVSLARAVTVMELRRRLGRSRFAFHASGRWVVLDVEEPYGIRTWSFDLDRPLVPSVPLLLPGLVFAAWVVIQMVPLPPSLAAALAGAETLPGAEPDGGWRTVSVSVAQTATGLGFLVWALVLHVLASSALAGREAERRFRRFVAGLGLVLATIGLAQMATRTRRVYWFFKPWEGEGEHIFGPFVDRDHFAFYMLMVTPVAFGLFAYAYRRYRARVGMRANLRRRLVTLSSPEGLSTLYAVVPALAAVSSLIATTSRGALIAFAGGLALAGLSLWRRRAVPVWAFAAVFTLVAFSWFGTDRIESRLRQVSQDAPGRTVIWQDTLERMGGRWVGGSGFNTFDVAMYRASAWALPGGASPWSDPYETTIVNVARVGFRTPEAIPGLWWYREAHNDYVQLLTETGAVGLLLALWAAARVLSSVRGDAWLLAAAAGVFMHEFVDFGLHVPAIVALFVALAAIRPHAPPASTA
jgi:hypothetical protein